MLYIHRVKIGAVSKVSDAKVAVTFMFEDKIKDGDYQGQHKVTTLTLSQHSILFQELLALTQSKTSIELLNHYLIVACELRGGYEVIRDLTPHKCPEFKINGLQDISAYVQRDADIIYSTLFRLNNRVQTKEGQKFIFKGEQ